MGTREFNQNRYRRGPTFLMGANNYDHACTVQPYNILIVKNVLVKPVYHIMAYTTSSLVSVPLLLSYFLYHLVGVMHSGEGV